ncbi:hypothetical protein J7L13_01220 [bacterium]|nr:hypothetical protein [bacterium]
MKVIKCPKCGSLDVRFIEEAYMFHCLKCDTAGSCEDDLHQWLADVPIGSNKGTTLREFLDLKDKFWLQMLKEALELFDHPEYYRAVGFANRWFERGVQLGILRAASMTEEEIEENVKVIEAAWREMPLPSEPKEVLEFIKNSPEAREERKEDSCLREAVPESPHPAHLFLPPPTGRPRLKEGGSR